MKINKNELLQLITLIEMDITTLESYIYHVNNRWDTKKEEIKLNENRNLKQKLETEYYSNKKEVEINVENS